MNRKALLKLPSADNPSKSGIRDMRNTVQIDHLRRIDDLIVLQHAIRRFRLHHEVDFRKLLELRKELSETLREELPKNLGEVFSDDLYAQSLWCCMRFLDSRANLQKLEQNGLEWVLPALTDDLKDIFSAHTFMHIDCLDVTALAKILVKFGPDITDISRRSNYTRFYSLLGLTSYVPGHKFYTHYINAKLGHHRIKPHMEGPLVNEEALWMFSIESDCDDDFSPLIQTSCGTPLRTSKNIQIYGGHQHSISINNILLKNRLVLSVPTNETPDRIDDALREFRAALMQEFINNCGGYFNVSTDDYNNSIFMTQYTHEVCLIKDWDQVQRRIVGLWSWDIACLEGKTVPFANEHVTNELERLKTKFRHGLPLYSTDTVFGYYEATAKEIGPRPPKKASEPTNIDRFVTRSNVILGSTNQDSTTP